MLFLNKILGQICRFYSMNRIVAVFLILFFISGKFAFGQKNDSDQKTDPDSTGVVNSNLLPSVAPLLLVDEEKEKGEKKEKKKKARKNIWFGIKTQRGFTKRELRGQSYFEFFNYTDADRTPDPYIRDIYWFDTKERAIKTTNYSKENGYLLHGPYERVVNEEVVESGMFYYGTKHKTWMLFDDKNVLQDKNHYAEGWPRESRISYYDRTSKSIEEIIPIQYSLEEGNYFYFHEDQQIAVTGEYKYGEKVGLWTEYWDTNNDKVIRKREIQYQEDPYTKNFRPYIRAEWDKDGNLIYRKDI
jgi:antitoxin component YwqK of YwqJK toxin-antitoxin module